MGTLILSCKDESHSNEEENQDERKREKIINLVPEKKPIRLTYEQKSYVDACNAFSFNLFRQTTEAKGSRILSPLSAIYALGMLNAGADDETSKEIIDALGFAGADRTSVNEYCLNLIENSPKVDSGVHLKIANALFVNKDISLLQQYAQDMRDYYHADIGSQDFSSSTAADEINSWCSSRTDGMISE